MTTTFLLVRHAEHEFLGRVLTGRTPGVHLGQKGCEQAERLAVHLVGLGAEAVQSGPMERAQETARPIAAALGVPVATTDALDEIDFGAWRGKTFDELGGDPRWRDWNERRSSCGAPGGETMRQVQARVLDHLRRLCAAHAGGRLVLVSHGDVIKAALVYVLGASLDAIERIEITPASISTVVLGEWGGKISGLNRRVDA